MGSEIAAPITWVRNDNQGNGSRLAGRDDTQEYESDEITAFHARQ